jgi:hypothetical protein
LERIEDFDEAAAAEFDAVVFAAPDIDRFCSSSSWILPFHAAFTPDAPIHAFRGEHGAMVVAETRTEGGAVILHALESMWSQACPIPALDPRAHAAQVARLLRSSELRWDLCLLGGILQGSEFYRQVGAMLEPRYRLLVGGHCARQLSDLSGGVEAFLARRSPNFRRSIRRAEVAAAAAGLSWEPATASEHEGALALHDRTLAIERRSWKGLEGVGAAEGPMHDFYRAMMPRLAERGMLRALFCRVGGEDAAYVLGAVTGGRFRGLQFSHAAEHAALALGNLGQLEMMRRMVAEGVRVWDLGSAVPYKRRWADRTEDSLSLAVLRQG